MNPLWLKLTLQSEASFSRGDGVPGVVDIEVNYDQHGFPFLGGRTLKGLLHAEAIEIVDALHRAGVAQAAHWATVAATLLGRPGSGMASRGTLHISDATLPEDLRQRVGMAVRDKTVTATEVLETLTTIRRQTAIDEERGAPKEETLRAIRVILRQTEFTAKLILPVTDEEAWQDQAAFLAACVKAFHRAGSNKTRGYGLLNAELLAGPAGRPVTADLFQRFKETILL